MFSFLRDCRDRAHFEPYQRYNFTFSRAQDEAACTLELEKAEKAVGDAVAMLAVSRSELVGCVGCDDAVAEAAGKFLNVKNYVKVMEDELAKARVNIGEKMAAIASDEYVFYAKYQAAGDHAETVARSVMGAMKQVEVELIGTEVEVRFSPGDSSLSVGDLVAYNYFPKSTLYSRTYERPELKVVAVVDVMEDGSYCILVSREFSLCFDFVSRGELMKIEA